MILNLSIPGQLAAMRATLNGSWPAWAVSSLPHAFAAGTLTGTAGTSASSATTSGTYVDLVDVSGVGIIQLAYGFLDYAASATTAVLRLEVDGVEVAELEAAGAVADTYLYVVGIATGASPLTGSTSPVLEAIPYTTGFKLQGKITAGGGSLLARYRYLPMELRT